MTTNPHPDNNENEAACQHIERPSSTHSSLTNTPNQGQHGAASAVGIEAITPPSTPPSRFDLLDLPTEMIEEITRVLPSKDRVIFGITCKALYEICLPGQIHLTKAGRRSVLCRLELDFGHLYAFCPMCEVLHSINGFSNASAVPHCRQAMFEPFSSIGSFQRGFSYQDARLISNNYRYGPPNGISLSQYEYKGDHQAQGKFDWTIKTEARFVKDELMFKSTLHIEGPQTIPSGHTLATYRLCRHQRLFDTYPAQLLFWEKQPIWQSSCCSCLMHWDAEVATINRSKHSATIRMYHLVGDIHNDQDPAWRTFFHVSNQSRLEHWSSIARLSERQALVVWPRGAPPSHDSPFYGREHPSSLIELWEGGY